MDTNEILGALLGYTEVTFNAHDTRVMRFMARDLPQYPLREEGRRFTNLDTGMEFWVKADSPITDVTITLDTTVAAE